MSNPWCIKGLHLYNGDEVVGSMVPVPIDDRVRYRPSTELVERFPVLKGMEFFSRGQALKAMWDAAEDPSRLTRKGIDFEKLNRERQERKVRDGD